ncbi:MAG: pilus assembly protein TadG-related protein, partial [Anaerolineales bacterium]
MSNLRQLPSHNPAQRKLQRGQAMVLIALAFIGLAAFTGLTVDAGILFIQIGHLRRAVDSASLAAANQFREGRSDNEIERAADEFINLNSLNPADADIFKCDLSDPTATNTNPYHDLTLCPDDLNGNGWYGPNG